MSPVHGGWQDWQDWQRMAEAARLYQQLVAGHPPVGTNVAPWLAPGEQWLSGQTFVIGRWRGLTVEESQPGVVAAGRPAFVFSTLFSAAVAGSVARRRAQRVAAPQWRYFGSHHAVLTSHRVLFQLAADGQWEGTAVSEVQVQPDLDRAVLDLVFAPEPIRLIGPAVAWWSVVLLWLHFGVSGLRHPGLRPLTRSW